jgi:hypothetical protein
MVRTLAIDTLNKIHSDQEFDTTVHVDICNLPPFVPGMDERLPYCKVNFISVLFIVMLYCTLKNQPCNYL